MKTLALTTALVLGLAAPAFANDAFSRSLGVEPGTLSTSELISLELALQEGEYHTANQIRKGSAGGVFSTKQVGNSVVNAQLSASLGVEPGVYSTNDLLAIQKAEEEGEYFVANQIRKGSAGGVFSTKSGGTSAVHDQLAASLNVDGSAFSTSDLLRLQKAEEEGEHFVANQIRKGY